MEKFCQKAADDKKAAESDNLKKKIFVGEYSNITSDKTEEDINNVIESKLKAAKEDLLKPAIKSSDKSIIEQVANLVKQSSQGVLNPFYI